MRHEICESGLRHGKEFDDEYILAELFMINAKAGPHGHGGKQIQCPLRVAPQLDAVVDAEGCLRRSCPRSGRNNSVPMADTSSRPAAWSDTTSPRRDRGADWTCRRGHQGRHGRRGVTLSLTAARPAPREHPLVDPRPVFRSTGAGHHLAGPAALWSPWPWRQRVAYGRVGRSVQSGFLIP